MGRSDRGPVCAGRKSGDRDLQTEWWSHTGRSAVTVINLASTRQGAAPTVRQVRLPSAAPERGVHDFTGRLTPAPDAIGAIALPIGSNAAFAEPARDGASDHRGLRSPRGLGLVLCRRGDVQSGRRHDPAGRSDPALLLAATVRGALWVSGWRPDRASAVEW